MCSLGIAATMALTAAQSVLTFKAQEAQYNAQMEAWRANVKSAGEALNDQTYLENTRMEQTKAQATHKLLELQKETLQAQGTAMASSEGGGLSEEMLLQDIEKQRADYSDAIAYNLKNEAAQSEFNKKAMHSEAESRARAGNPGPAPSLGMSLGLDLAGAAIDAYSTYHVSAPSRRGDIKSASSTKKRPPTYPGI